MSPLQSGIPLLPKSGSLPHFTENPKVHIFMRFFPIFRVFGGSLKNINFYVFFARSTVPNFNDPFFRNASNSVNNQQCIVCTEYVNCYHDELNIKYNAYITKHKQQINAANKLNESSQNEL